MAGTITHYWTGSVLTVTSDSGTSSADLSGPTGCRGPQGRPGVIYDSDGNLYLDDIPSTDEVEALTNRVSALENQTRVTTEYVATKIAAELDDYYDKTEVDTKLQNVSVDLTGYATEEYVQDYVANNASGGGSVDLSNYATKSYVNNAVANIEADVDLTNYPTYDDMSTAIAQAQLGGDSAEIDLSGLATKTYVNELADGSTIILENGHISTSFGGELIGQEGGDFIGAMNADTGATLWQDGNFYAILKYGSGYFTLDNVYDLEITINNTIITKVSHIIAKTGFWQDTINNPYFSQVRINEKMSLIELALVEPDAWTAGTYTVTNCDVYTYLIKHYNPIDANAIPVDNTTIVVNAAGKLSLGTSGDLATVEYVNEAIAEAQLGGGESVDLSNYATKTYVDNAVANKNVDLSNYYTKAQTEAYVLEQIAALEAKFNTKFASITSSEGVEY